MPSSRTASSIACAHRTARAGPSNVARNPSPVVSTSVPRWRVDLALRPLVMSARAVASTRASPSSAALLVESTMSVNSTVASTRSASAASGRTPGGTPRPPRAERSGSLGPWEAVARGARRARRRGSSMRAVDRPPRASIVDVGLCRARGSGTRMRREDRAHIGRLVLHVRSARDRTQADVPRDSLGEPVDRTASSASEGARSSDPTSSSNARVPVSASTSTAFLHAPPRVQLHGVSSCPRQTVAAPRYRTSAEANAIRVRRRSEHRERTRPRRRPNRAGRAEPTASRTAMEIVGGHLERRERPGVTRSESPHPRRSCRSAARTSRGVEVSRACGSNSQSSSMFADGGRYDEVDRAFADDLVRDATPSSVMAYCASGIATQLTTRYRCHRSGTPFSSCSPASSNVSPSPRPGP